MSRTPEVVGRPWEPIFQHPFEACTCVGGMLTGAVALIRPHILDTAAVGHVTGSGLWLWIVLYLSASALTFWGLLRSLRIEAVGLCLTIAAVTVQAASVMIYHGWSALISASLFIAVGWGSLIRLRVIGWVNSQRTRAST